MIRSVWAFRLVLVGVFAALSLSAAFAEVPDSERVLITDPAVLVSMGFPPNAQNVYRGTHVTVPAPNSDAAEDFGTIYDFTTFGGKEFVGRQDTTGTQWAWNGGGEGCCDNLSRYGSEQWADAQVKVATGLRMAAIRWWINDSDATNNMAMWLFEICQPGFEAGPTTHTTIAELDPLVSGSAGNYSGLLTFNVSNYHFDNENCRYTLRARFDAIGNTLTLQKVRIQWVREVSPAPATATFLDVPTTSSYFQFVEALYASGVIAGCGGNNYCPNNPVTRGQMAVYLAKSLGMSWP